MAEYGAELPEGFTLDETQQATEYGAELPEGFSLDETPMPKPDPVQDMDTFLQGVPEYQEQPQGDMNVASFEKTGANLAIDPQKVKSTVKTGIDYLRPTIEGLSAAGAGIATTAAAVPTTGPFAPAVGAAGAAAGYTAAKQGLDRLEEWATLPPEVQKLPAMKQMKNTMEDFRTGLTFEFGGPAAMKVLSYAGKGVAGGFNKIKDIVRKNTPALTEEQISKRAAEIIQEHRGNLNQYDKNLAESVQVGDEIPGFKSTIGEKTGDPGLIKLQRGLEAKPGVAAELNQVQQAENVEAIERYLKESFDGGQTIDDVINDLAAQKANLRRATGAAETTAKATERAIPTEQPQVTGRKITGAISEAKEPYLKAERELWKQVPDYEMSPTNTEKAFKELSAKPSEARTKIKSLYADFIERKGGTGSQTIKREDLTETEREINGILFDKETKNNTKRLIGKIKDAITDDFATMGKAADEGDFATFEGKVVHPKKLQRELAETTERLEKEIATEAEAKPDIKQIYSELQEAGTPAIMRQVAEEAPDYAKRISQTYKNVFKKDPPMIAAKERPLVTSLKQTKADIEKTLAGAEPAENIAKAYKTAKDYSKKNIIDRFRKGVIDELETTGKFEGGKKLPTEARPKKLMDVESADKFINAVGKEKAANIMLRHYADDMAKKVKYGDDGILNAPSLKNWIRKNGNVLDRYGIKKDFSTAEKAHKALQEARIAEQEFNKSIAAKMLNADPQNAMAQAFTGGDKISSKNTGDIMRNLLKRVKNNPDAIKGLENGFKDFMYEQSKTTAQTLKGDSKLSKATLDKSLKRFAPAMAVLYKGQPDKIKALQNIRKALLIMNRTDKGVGSGPDTAEKMSISIISNILGIATKIPGISYSVKLGKLGLGNLKNLNEKETSDFIAKLLYDPDLAKIINKASRKNPPVKRIENDLKNYMDRAITSATREKAKNDNTNNK